MAKITIQDQLRICGMNAYKAADLIDNLLSSIHDLKQDNAALLKQWNDLDQRTEKFHRKMEEEMINMKRDN